MKIVVFFINILFLLLQLPQQSYSQEVPPFSNHIEHMWFDGRQDEVLIISQQLLLMNPDSFVGLILKLECEIDSLYLDSVIKTVDRLSVASKTITTTHLLQELPLLQESLSTLKMLIPIYPPEELEKDKSKIGKPNTHFGHLRILIAAEKDGLVSISDILFDGKGQKPDDVNFFLGYLQPAQAQTELAEGTTSYTVHLYYAETVDPATFTAELNKQDIASLFSPKPFTGEEVKLPLQKGRNTLILSIEGTRKDGKKATDSDRLVFIVP